MSCLKRGLMIVTLAGLLPVIAVFSTQAQAEDAGAACQVAAGGRCDFTALGEGVYRIELVLPAAQADKLRELAVSGQSCPLTRQGIETPDKGTHLACFAYLSGGITYKINIPAEAQVFVAMANPAHGEPITLIP